MNPVDLLLIAIIGGIVGLAVWFIVRSKKKGVQCIGCPDAKNCASKGCGSCSCGCGR